MGTEDTENTELWPMDYEETMQPQDFVHVMVWGGDAVRDEYVGGGGIPRCLGLGFGLRWPQSWEPNPELELRISNLSQTC